MLLINPFSVTAVFPYSSLEVFDRTIHLPGSGFMLRSQSVIPSVTFNNLICADIKQAFFIIFCSEKEGTIRSFILAFLLLLNFIRE